VARRLLEKMKCTKLLSFALIGSITVYTCGCTHTNTYQPEHLYNERDKDILVYANDGRIILFKSGDYKTGGDAMPAISGKGKLVINKEKEEYKDFEGTVGFSEIQNITTTETTTVGRIAVVGWITLGTVLLLFIAFPLHINFH
jgi:hypothetical protein